MAADEIGASHTQIRRWRRGVHCPEGKFAERVRDLQRKTSAIYQCELFDVEMQRCAHREAAIRHVERSGNAN
jgi:hypothetical protein